MRTKHTGVIAAGVVAVSAMIAAAGQAQPAPAPQVEQKLGAPDPSPAPLPGAKPGLKFETTTHDFGVISDDKPVTHRFNFTNTSDRVISIRNVQTSCGCTTSPLTKRTFAPGESYHIEATFNPQNRRGKELKTLHVDTDDPGFGRYDLQINVDIRPRVLVEPQILMLGMLKAGQPAQGTLTLTGRTADFDVTEARLRDERLKLTRSERTKIMRDGDSLWQVVYTVDVPANLPLGAVRSFIDLTTNDPERRTLSVPVNADVIGDLAVLPDRLTLQLSRAGDRWQREVRIEHRSKQPFSITGLDVESPEGMDVVMDFMEDGAGGAGGAASPVQRLRVSGSTPKTPGRISGKLVIKTDVPGMETIELPMAGNYNPVAAAPAPQQPTPLIFPNNQPPAAPRPPVRNP
jgi:hypothetical protein